MPLTAVADGVTVLCLQLPCWCVQGPGYAGYQSSLQAQHASMALLYQAAMRIQAQS